MRGDEVLDVLRADRRNPHVRERQVQVLGRRGQRFRVGAVEVRAVLARAIERYGANGGRSFRIFPLLLEMLGTGTGQVERVGKGGLAQKSKHSNLAKSHLPSASVSCAL